MDPLHLTEARASLCEALSLRTRQFLDALTAVLTASKRRVCEEYTQALRIAAEDLDAPWSTDWRRLSQITSVRLRSSFGEKNDDRRPFDGLESRGAITSEECERWARIARTIDEPDLIARCSHLAWLNYPPRNRPPTVNDLAREAIRSYLKTAINLGLAVPSHYCQTRIFAAINLSRKISDATLEQECATASMFILDTQRDYTTASSYRLMEKLLEVKLLNSELRDLCVQICDEAAAFAEANPKSPCYDDRPSYMVDILARGYLETKMMWMRAANSQIKFTSDWTRIGHLHLRTRDYWLAQPESFQTAACAAHAQSDAVKAFEEAGVAAPEFDQHHAHLLRLQKREASLLMKTAGQPQVDNVLSELATRNAREFAQADFGEVMGRLLARHPPEYQTIVDMFNTQGSVSALLPQSRIAKDGRIVGSKPAVDIDTDVIMAMANWQRRFGAAFVLPAVRAMRDRFTDELLALLSLSEFVPVDRRQIYRRGIQAGLEEDWIISIHLLPQQIEHALRIWLQQEGLITSGLERNVQHEHDLNKMLVRDDVRRTLGEDLSLDLRASLTHQFGSNIRNMMAHGLIADNECASVDAVYLWWLSVRLAILWPPKPEEEASV